MRTGRLEAFTDAVIAIALTIMVLELPRPHEVTWAALQPDIPVFLAYVLSFIYLGIYWNNHHHMLAATTHVSGGVLWANLHLLFWLSLVPFSTDWMSESAFATAPTALYGLLLLAAAIAYFILSRMLLRAQNGDDRLKAAIGRDRKGRISPILYCVGIAGTFLSPWIGVALYVVVAGMWLIPDRRVERVIEQEDAEHSAPAE